ncbi:SCO1664 family protein [Actinacidiphila yeochonensis]|uniref:SCO1664 family protein n=1 Tax=Actinacidiphila yeochonensis TaxID=89050 RepID=UPI00055BC85C|nr:SCO1664 family protein [Actinacidiphila yeochonensis]
MPAPERIPEVGLSPAARQGHDPRDVEALLHGELTVKGQIRDASNAVLYCEAGHDGRTVACVYKPVAGERPLWDFPDGTLAQREVAAYLVSEATGWGLVPPTVLRDGPYGEGMVQLWVDAQDDDAEEPDAEDAGSVEDAEAEDAESAGDAGSGEAIELGAGGLLALTEKLEPAPGWKAVVRAELADGRPVLLVHADDARLRRLAVLDAVLNNADRKGGHLLASAGGRLHGIDHGVTFHTDDKLRTLLWGWAGEPLPAEALVVLEKLSGELSGALGERLEELITRAETAALRARVRSLLESGRHPEPGGEWPSIPWPPV